MRHTLLAALLLASCAGLRAQHNAYTLPDTAAQVVDTYLRLLNLGALPHDSTLYLETTITSPGTTDTFVMRRWHTPPQMFRVEVWRGHELQDGLCSNGAARFRQFQDGQWFDIPASQFHSELQPYDFRGPLYGWRTRGTTLSWRGTADYNGTPLKVVAVSTPGMYERLYMFDPNNDLLALIIETDSLHHDYAPSPESHIQWKVIHEYLPVGTSLVPTLESFLRGTTLTILATEPRLLPRNILIYNRD